MFGPITFKRIISMTNIAEEVLKPPAWNRCGSCGLVKLLEEFPTATAQGRDYHRGTCKKCMAGYWRQINERRKAKKTKQIADEIRRKT